MRANDLNRVAALGRDLTRSVDPLPRVWLLDEITSVPQWTSTLKYLRDNTLFGEDTVVCTGSSWDQVANVERDLLAGRAGRHTVRRLRLLLPMSFRDVVRATARKFPLPAVVAPWNLQGGLAKAAAVEAELFTDDLDFAWQSYLTSGGFPRAVAEHHRLGSVSDGFAHDLLAWLHRDVDAEVSNDSVALLLDGLARHSTSPLNRSAAAGELGYASRQNFELRLNRMVSCFAAIWCPQINEHGGKVPNSQPKLYLLDPLIASLGSYVRAGLGRSDSTQLTENAMGIAMARAIDASEEGRWMSQDTIGYLRSGKGNEIDLSPVPVPTASGVEYTTPLESKWVSHGWRGESRSVDSKFGRGILATRNIIDTTTSVWALPAPLVALLLG